MSTDLAHREDAGLSDATLADVVLQGDLSKLNDRQKVEYYVARCHAAGLDPATRPFEYLTLKGKHVLYATKACTDQLSGNHKLNIEIVDRHMNNDAKIFEVQCRVTFPGGRYVEDMAALDVSGLKGEMLANALMKCFHPATEILTTDGWVAISTVTTDDHVAQYDPKTRAVFFAPPIRVIETETEHWVEVSDNISRQMVTPNHDVLVGDQKIEAADLMAAEADLKRWRGADQPAPIPVSGFLDSSGMTIKDCEIRLMAAFLSDGAWTPSESQVQFGFHKLRKVERLRSLLAEADWPFSENIYDVQQNDRFHTDYETRTVFYLKTPAPWFFASLMDGDKALTMKTILQMDVRQARVFVEEMAHWDGCVDGKGGIIFQQSNQKVADSLQLLCVLHGIDLSTRRIAAHKNSLPNARPLTRMRLSNAELRPGRRARRSYEVFANDDRLKAYCVEVSTGAVITRFEGQVAISGNCVTKAKRRTILSALGLGLLDETEVETIPGAQYGQIEDNGAGDNRRSLPAPKQPKFQRSERSAGVPGGKVGDEQIARVQAYLKDVVETTNARWLDYWTERYGSAGIPSGFKEACINGHQLSNHMAKWLGSPPIQNWKHRMEFLGMKQHEELPTFKTEAEAYADHILSVSIEDMEKSFEQTEFDGVIDAEFSDADADPDRPDDPEAFPDDEDAEIDRLAAKDAGKQSPKVNLKVNRNERMKDAKAD